MFDPGSIASRADVCMRGSASSTATGAGAGGQADTAFGRPRAARQDTGERQGCG